MGLKGTGRVTAERPWTGGSTWNRANIVSALDLYKLSNGGYPTEAQGLKALVERPQGLATWDGPYLTRGDGINDPWGKPYIYKVPGTHGAVDIMTLGADAKEGGTGEDADQGSW